MKDNSDSMEHLTFNRVRYESVAGKTWAVIEVREKDQNPEALEQEAFWLAFPKEAIYWEIVLSEETDGEHDLRVMLGEVTAENRALQDKMRREDEGLPELDARPSN